MKKAQYELSRSRKILRRKQQEGVEFVIWNLTKQQLDFIGRFYDVEPYLFQVTTIKFEEAWQLPELLKKLDYTKRVKHKEYKILPLNEKERKLLRQWNIPYKPANKFKIYLNPKK